MSVTREENIRLAATFALAAHGAIDHRRKHIDEPYFNHLERVAATVGLSMRCNARMTIVAFLHDVVEDTKITAQTLRRTFDDQVIADVLALTKPHVSLGTRRWRSDFYRAQVAQASFEARCVKLADMIDNLPSIAAHDPEFAKVYTPECEQMLIALEGTDPVLELIARSKIEDAKALLAAGAEAG